MKIKKHFRKGLLAIIFFSLITTANLWAVPASPYPISVIQSDGSTLTIRLHGDEYFHYKTSTDGYLLVEDEVSGFYNYAKIDSQGKIDNLNIRATDPERRTYKESEFLKTIETVESVSNSVRLENIYRAKRSEKNGSKAPIQKSYPLVGSHRSLVILVNFRNKSFVTPNPKDAFTKLLNEPGYSTNGGTGSAKDYFRDNSNGKFIPQFEVVGPYTLPGDMATYGANNQYGEDVNPRQMVKDACALAAADSVDFSLYDVDNDSIVDNVFIYYAGYNEAESGFPNTVWPHRYKLLYDETTKYNGRVVVDYACTSELRNSSGGNMCGIGTFCHEFGHVLGLVDFYPTNGATHHTLYTWDIMDHGPYLNYGRTPPAYSSHERFFLGWLTPIEINTPRTYTLDTLTSSNTAYLISQHGNHNLNGLSPNPKEYFLLENRQNKGWDTYIPGHGLLITRVYFNAPDWAFNTPNNYVNTMGVDIMEADGLADNHNCAGDPFPGTSNKTSHNLKLRSGVDLMKPLSEITEVNGKISFKFMGGEFDPNLAPLATSATNVSYNQFTANWNAQHKLANGYFIDVYTKNNNVKEYLSGYQNKNVGNVLSLSIGGLKADTTYYYVVRATDGDTITINSNEVSVNTTPLTLNLFKPLALDATDITSSSFKAHWSWNTTDILPQKYILSVYKKDCKDTVFSTCNFDNSKLATNWTAEHYSFYSGNGYYGVSSPSLYFTQDESMLMTETFPYAIKSIDFWYRGKNAATTNSLNILGSSNGTDWKLIKTVNPLNNSLGEKISLSGASLLESKVLKFVYSKPSDGYIALDDIKIGIQDVSIIPIAKYDSIDVGNVLEYLVNELDGNTKYFYTVFGSNQSTSTEKSNEIIAQTLMSSSINQNSIDSYSVKTVGDELLVISGRKSTVMKMFNLSGQQMMESVFDDTLRIDKKQISNGIYILKVDNVSFKFIITN